MSAPTIAPVRLCACGRPVRAYHTACGTCESRAYRVRRAAGLNVPRRRVPLDDVAHLLASGVQLPEVARRLGTSMVAVQRAVRRALATEDRRIRDRHDELEEYTDGLARLLRLLAAEADEREAWRRAQADADNRRAVRSGRCYR